MSNTVMKDVAKAENAFTNDETMRYKYMLREKAIRDYYSGLADAKQEGMEIGEKRGEERGERKAIIGMLRHQLEPEYIAQILQCPVEKVELIAKECQV